MSDRPDIANIKHQARERARTTRAAIGRADRRIAADRAARLLVTMPEVQHAGALVLGYAALPEEIDSAPAIELLRAAGLRIAYPRVEAGGILTLHLAEEADLAPEGRFGIREPNASAPRVEPAVVDVVLVPGVAFDEQRFRLGYGGGYYDRLLPLLRHDATRIGLAFEEQIVGELPREDHDMQLDAIVTADRIIRG